MSTSIASPNNSVRDTLPPYNASTPTAHKFTGVAETTDGYNSLSILLTAEFSVIIRVYQSQSNVGVWNDIEIFNYPSNNEAAGIAIYKTVLVKTAWFKVEVENISGNDNLVYLHTMKINSATGTNNYISVSSLEINGEVSGLYNGLLGVTGSSTITVPADTYIGITGMVGVSGYYNGLVGVTGSSVITVPANTFIGITGMVGVSGMYNGLVGITGSATIFGRDYIGGNTNTIYLDSKGVQITQLAKTDTNTVEYNLYTDLKNIIQLSPSYFSLDKDMINDGWYYDSTPEYNVGVVSFYDNLKFYNQPNFSLNDTTVWAIISCKNIDIAKTIAPPSIVVSTLPDASATYWRYRVPPDVKLYSGVSYLFYYGSKAIELNPSYTPILLTRTEGTAILTNNINATIFRISIYLGEYVPPPQGQAPVIRDSRNTTYLVKSAGLWDSNLNTSFVAEFGPKMSNIQVVGGTDGTLKYPIYTDVCGVQRTNIIETYKQSYKFILETDAPYIVKGPISEFTTDPRNRDGWYNNTYNAFNSLTWGGTRYRQ